MKTLVLAVIGLLLLSGCLREEASFRRTKQIKEAEEKVQSANIRLAAYMRGGANEGRQSWVFTGLDDGQWLEIVDRFRPHDGQVADKFTWRSNFMRLRDGHWEVGLGPVEEGPLNGTVGDWLETGSWEEPETGWTFVMAEGQLTVQGRWAEGDVAWTLERQSFVYETIGGTSRKAGAN